MHSIKQFCDKIDSIKSMADDLRKTPPSDPHIKNKIEVRPTMTGNFINNPVVKYLDYSVSKNLKNAEYIDKNGFFFGNYPKNLTKELNLVYKLIVEEIVN